MKTLLITEYKLKKLIRLAKIKTDIKPVILDIEEISFSKIQNINNIVLLTTKILNRKNNHYVKLLKLLKNKKTKVIEIALEKSKLSQEKSNSLAIVHGFGKITYNILNKILKSLD